MPADPFIQRVFTKPLGNEKIYACFIRRYDAAHLARLVRIGVDALDGNQTADRGTRRGGQRLHIVIVVPHPDGFWKASPRHDQ